jgi:radical SAM-linked protein
MARYIIKFEKGRGIKFISHLDIMRTFQRAIRRAGLPITYSKGFNPHAEISFASPLPVGTCSTGEYLDMGLDREIDAKVIYDGLNNELPSGIRIIDAKEAPDNFPTLMSMVDAASYEITLAGVSGEIGQGAIDKFKSLPGCTVIKVGKNGSREVDIKPMVRDIKLLSSDKNTAVIYVLLDSGSRNNLNPELLCSGLKQCIDDFKDCEIRDIKKMETYVEGNGRLTAPLELL